MAIASADPANDAVRPAAARVLTLGMGSSDAWLVDFVTMRLHDSEQRPDERSQAPE
jgi:hypothetical protein